LTFKLVLFARRLGGLLRDVGERKIIDGFFVDVWRGHRLGGSTMRRLQSVTPTTTSP
jgi:hypothetical protein